MKHLPRFIYTLLLALTSLACPAFAAERPHIIVLLADDLGWGDVSYHAEGQIATPHIDRLAARGAQLNRFYSQPVCSPTRAALMTGRYPMRYGMQCGVVKPWANHGLPLQEQTLADGLKAAGYKTAIVGKWHLGHYEPQFLPLQRGFDRQYGHYNGALDYFTHEREGGHDWHRNDQPNHDEGYATDLLGKEAAGIIEAHNLDQPLFLYVPFNAPHTPLQATDEHLERNAHIKDRNRRTFAAMVTSMDDAIGRIIAAADKRLPRDNTVIVFFSDNGGIVRLGSNGKLRDGKGTLYEGGVRVPAIMAWDGAIKAGSVIREPMHVVDLYPTLLSLAGSEVAQKLPIDGKNVWPSIRDGKKIARDFILHNLTPFHGAIRMGDWKLVHNGQAGANATTATGPETWELFDLSVDPFEKNDLSAKRPEMFRKLKAKLAKLAGEAAAPHIAPTRKPQNFDPPSIWGHAK
ncbi:MAG: arylsulfatase B [Planctomycetota bacterium]